MKNKSTNLLQLLVISLFVVAPFVMTFENVEIAELISARTLPSFVSTFSSWYRWGVLGLLSVLSIFYLNENQNLKISTPVYFISFFYFFQFLYALIDGVDYNRFLLMTLFSLTIPPVIGLAISQDKRIIRYFTYSIVLFILISVVLNGHLVLIGQRFFGFLSNPNTYGISTVFWLVTLMLAIDYKLIGKKLFIGILISIFLTMLFSGSRNAMVGMMLIFAFRYYSQFNKMAVRIFILLFAFLVASYFVDLSFVTNRFENIFNATSDSGRKDIWEQAYFAIGQNFWWGNGMDANLRIANTGNMHNSYIRFILNMGLFFTILTLLMYIFSILKTYRQRSKVPLVLIGYLLVFGLMNIGEDFFVGLGSSVFIYLLFIYGFINFYITNQDATSR